MGGGGGRRARLHSHFRGGHRTGGRPTVHDRRPDRQREGCQLYGECADLALSGAEQGRILPRGRRAGDGAMRNMFAEALYREATENPDVFIVVADISPVGNMAKFRTEYPERFIN